MADRRQDRTQCHLRGQWQTAPGEPELRDLPQPCTDQSWVCGGFGDAGGDTGHGQGLFLLLLSEAAAGQGPVCCSALGIPPGGSGYVPDEGRRWGEEGLPTALAAPRGLRMMETQHIPCCLCLYPPHAHLPPGHGAFAVGAWQIAVGSGSPGTPREGGGQSTDPRTCPCCWEASISSQVDEGKKQAAGLTRCCPCSEVIIANAQV